MTPHELIDLQMRYRFGLFGMVELTSTIREVFERGEWRESFLPFLVEGDLKEAEAEQILEALCVDVPAGRLDMEKIARVVDRYMSRGELTWLVGPDLALIIADDQRVGKLVDSELAWLVEVTCADPIELQGLENDVVVGSYYDPCNSTNDHIQPLRVAYAEGTIIEGDGYLKFPETE